MTFFDVNKEDFESFTLVTNPKRYYRSSSIESAVTPHGITGSIYLSSRRMTCLKDINVLNTTSSQHSDDTTKSLWKEIKSNDGSTNITSKIQNYMDAVRAASTSEIETRDVHITRFTPTTRFTEYTLRKQHIKDVLNKHYRISYPTAHWAYTNYNCLNFFTSSATPTESVLIYPSLSNESQSDLISGSYALTGAFSLCCKIKPNQRNDVDTPYKAGTIYHMSSSYVLSLVSGNLKDGNGCADSFRLMLQLSHSADISPSVANNGVYPNDLIFFSDDNVIKFGEWNDVVVRWGTNTINEGTGSFVINGVERGTFLVPSSTIAPAAFVSSSQPSVLFVGNFYEGNNTGNNSIGYFFSVDTGTRMGLDVIETDSSIWEPTTYTFNHPLRAELHELKIATKYYNDGDIAYSSSMGLSEIPAEVVFYVPPFFIKESPVRRFVAGRGGILTSPFLEIDGITTDPFNIAMSFNVRGHEINLENFTKDFAQQKHPLLLSLTASRNDTTTDVREANEFLYQQQSLKKRNLTILPCDDGDFVPNYNLLNSSTASNMSKFVNDMGVRDLSLINLDNLCSTGSKLFGSTFETINQNNVVVESNTWSDELIGPTPEKAHWTSGSAWVKQQKKINMAIADGTFTSDMQDSSPYTIYQRTRDPSSNEVVMFNIDDLFYGNRIRPTTVVLTDPDMSGSDNEISITLRDDGYGNLYRDDTRSGTGATWNSVGNVYYDEGIILVKSPHLSFFGEKQFEISFEGEQNVHVLSIDVIAHAGMQNSSSNPSYNMHLSASGYDNDPDSKFVQISQINFHDDNYNVVARANLAQPIVKRHSDAYTFRTKIDF